MDSLTDKVIAIAMKDANDATENVRALRGICLVMYKRMNELMNLILSVDHSLLPKNLTEKVDGLIQNNKKFTALYDFLIAELKNEIRTELLKETDKDLSIELEKKIREEITNEVKVQIRKDLIYNFKDF
jgi:hypothetical protein